jgi:hypothetical protein
MKKKLKSFFSKDSLKCKRKKIFLIFAVTLFSTTKIKPVNAVGLAIPLNKRIKNVESTTFSDLKINSLSPFMEPVSKSDSLFWMQFRFFVSEANLSPDIKRNLLKLRGGSYQDKLVAVAIIILVAYMQINLGFSPIAINPAYQRFYDGQPGSKFRSIASTSYKYRTESKIFASQRGENQNSLVFYLNDGRVVKTTDKSVSHLISKHGHVFHINDTKAIDPNQKQSCYPGVRTKENDVNRKQFISNLERFCSDPNTKFIKDACVRGKIADIYYCNETCRFIAIRNNITTGKGVLIRAQSFNRSNLERLECDHKIN